MFVDCRRFSEMACLDAGETNYSRGPWLEGLGLMGQVITAPKIDNCLAGDKKQLEKRILLNHTLIFLPARIVVGTQVPCKTVKVCLINLTQ